MHEYSGNQCTIRITASEPITGWVTEHIPIGIEITDYQGAVFLETDTEEIEPGTIPNRFVFDYTMNGVITFTTSQPLETPNHYWVTWSPGDPNFGYEDENVKFSTN